MLRLPDTLMRVMWAGIALQEGEAMSDTIKNIAKYIDHTNINKKAKAKDIKKTCDEAKKYNFRGVCINPQWVKFVKKELRRTDIETNFTH